MGEIEREVKTRVRRQNLQKYILGSVAVAGLLGVAFLAPNVIQVLRQFGWVKNRRQIEIIESSRKRLVAAGLLSYDGGFLRLTKKGEVKLRQLELVDFRYKKPKQWDRKWRVLIFDIKEARRRTRDQIRLTLKRIGFFRLQYSVWVYPYDCEDLINLLKADFKIGKDVIYMVVDVIENDKKLKEYFNLS